MLRIIGRQIISKSKASNELVKTLPQDFNRAAGSLAGLKGTYTMFNRSTHKGILCVTSFLIYAGYDDKENAEEAIFFKKEDEKLLRELLSKVRAQAEKHDVHSAKGTLVAEKSALDQIVGSKLTEAEKEAVLAWKHKHF
jgi:hypothetical protein